MLAVPAETTFRLRRPQASASPQRQNYTFLQPDDTSCSVMLISAPFVITNAQMLKKRFDAGWTHKRETTPKDNVAVETELCLFVGGFSGAASWTVCLSN